MNERRFRAGKLPHEVLERLIGQYTHSDPRLVVPPGLGEDAAVIDDARGLAAEVVRADLTLADHRPLADLVDAVMGPSRISYLDKS